eukprot:112286-Prymnesium_polylepis.1
MAGSLRPSRPSSRPATAELGTSKPDLGASRSAASSSAAGPAGGDEPPGSFMASAGAPRPRSTRDRLAELKLLRDDELVSCDEYETARKAILD